MVTEGDYEPVLMAGMGHVLNPASQQHHVSTQPNVNINSFLLCALLVPYVGSPLPKICSIFGGDCYATSGWLSSCDRSPLHSLPAAFLFLCCAGGGGVNMEQLNRFQQLLQQQLEEH